MWQYTRQPFNQLLYELDYETTATEAINQSRSRSVAVKWYGKLEAEGSWDRTRAITKRDAPRRAGVEVREMNGRHASRRISQSRVTNECNLFTLPVVASVFLRTSQVGASTFITIWTTQSKNVSLIHTSFGLFSAVFLCWILQVSEVVKTTSARTYNIYTELNTPVKLKLFLCLTN
jgi:hypothetical protein